MARTVNAKQAALRKAREKRLELEAHRDARDRRVEETAAEILILLDQRAEVQSELTRLDESVGDALRALLDEGLDVAGAAQLAGLTIVEVRRRTRATSTIRAGGHRSEAS